MNKWWMIGLSLVSTGVIALGGLINSFPRNDRLIEQSAQSVDRIPDELEQSYQSLLAQAERLAQESRFAEAIALIEGIPSNSQSFESAKRLKQRYASEVLTRAKKRYERSGADDVDAALSMLSIIPVNTPTYAEVAQLQPVWKQQQSLLATAENAEALKDWQTVVSALSQLKNTPLYSTPRVQAMLRYADQQLAGTPLTSNSTRSALLLPPPPPSTLPPPPASWTDDTTEGAEYSWDANDAGSQWWTPEPPAEPVSAPTEWNDTPSTTAAAAPSVPTAGSASAIEDFGFNLPTTATAPPAQTADVAVTSEVPSNSSAAADDCASAICDFGF